jgi:GNAT superfamily N-acetyltransferase
MEIRSAESRDVEAMLPLTAEVVGTVRAETVLRSHLERHHVLVAVDDDRVVGLLAFRTDWFGCTYVSVVSVHKDARRRGIARALYRRVEDMTPSPRLFSSTEETNGVSIRMHAGLGFVPSGHIDNLPQGYRELLFYKRLAP